MLFANKLASTPVSISTPRISRPRIGLKRPFGYDTVTIWEHQFLKLVARDLITARFRSKTTRA
ncbi:MAG: hypothetical protein IPQ00_18010 [Chloracidobacterium sp.]|nr:hypothetical protein [Chloracidobacterium sp.]